MGGAFAMADLDGVGVRLRIAVTGVLLLIAVAGAVPDGDQDWQLS
jgi:hypothetical protein